MRVAITAAALLAYCALAAQVRENGPVAPVAAAFATTTAKKTPYAPDS
jgi:hypothetical protein